MDHIFICRRCGDRRLSPPHDWAGEGDRFRGAAEPQPGGLGLCGDLHDWVPVTVTVSGDWTPPYTVEVWTSTEAIGVVIASPGLEPEVILVRPDRPLRREEQVAVNEYFRRVYPHVPTPFPDAEGPRAVPRV